MVEAYDLDQAAASKLGNISTRGFVDVDDNVMIAGSIAGPGNGTSLKILVRALGPTLSDFGVPGVGESDARSGEFEWDRDSLERQLGRRPGQRAAIEAAGLAPSHAVEAALVETVAREPTRRLCAEVIARPASGWWKLTIFPRRLASRSPTGYSRAERAL